MFFWISVLLWAVTAPAGANEAPLLPPDQNVTPAATAQPHEPLLHLPANLRASIESGATGDWSARAGESLRDVLTRWTASADWVLLWATDSERNVVLDSNLAFPAGTTLRDAVRTTFRALSRGSAGVKACEYQNRTLRIVALGARCE
ncbi:MAG: TcpQ domain-containing protein [Ahniella sp.]|nr:TcpQ domain-containing protein [Ahniella sp.]